ncbi:hypothetical protein [Christiangramia crocea]|uniref:Uncharacterized protein n=1 Tax=Christiangramia crocea TaxID=2904124 RepID=A0A9X2A7T4_9FLAO|nr:hypothetical protein [Gramella crocea]MCG9971148.1 hypothetical protein [Gramella crocea]
MKNQQLNILLARATKYILKLSSKHREKFISTLIEVQKIQKSNFTAQEKSRRIKIVLWNNQSPRMKLVIGGFLGTIAGLITLGTGGIGIAAAGGAIGIWGFLAGTAGGVFISAIVQIFEKDVKKLKG